MPPMTQAQLQMAAQQQLAPLQQQQQAQQAQAAAAAAHLASQQQQFQNLVQGGGHQRIDPSQFQQLQLRQLAQANMSRAQGAVANMAQANAMARVQAAMHVQHQQQQQMGDVGMQGQGQGQGQQGQMNFGSPRPPQMQQGQVGPAMQQNKNMRQTIAKLSAMPEAQREQIFNTVSHMLSSLCSRAGLMPETGDSSSLLCQRWPNGPNPGPTTGQWRRNAKRHAGPCTRAQQFHAQQCTRQPTHTGRQAT